MDPKNEFVELEYYPSGNLKQYIRDRAGITESLLKHWAPQSVAFIHSKGVRHSDIRARSAASGLRYKRPA